MQLGSDPTCDLLNIAGITDPYDVRSLKSHWALWLNNFKSELILISQIRDYVELTDLIIRNWPDFPGLSFQGSNYR